MCIVFGDYKIMKKIIILTALFFTGSCFSTIGYAACPINNIGACKADIGVGINDSFKDRIIPDNLNKMVRPKSTMEIREQTLQPQLPSNINTKIKQQETSPGYDANCQFGNCINPTPDSEVSR